MKISIINPENKKEVTNEFPISEKDIMRTCKYLGITNDFTNKVKATIVVTSNKILKDVECNLDELNHLTKELSLLDKKQLKEFWSTKDTQIKDLINLACNFNIYGVDNFYTLYNGQTLPYSKYDNPVAMATLYHSKTQENEFLYLPFEQSALNKCLKRLNCENLDEVNISITKYKFSQKTLDLIVEEPLEVQNKFAFFTTDLEPEQYIQVDSLIEHLDITTLDSLEILLKEFENFRVYVNISSAEEYAKLLINSAVEIECLVDHQSIGAKLVEDEYGMFINSDYYGYLSDNQDLINLISQENNELDFKM